GRFHRGRADVQREDSHRALSHPFIRRAVRNPVKVRPVRPDEKRRRVACGPGRVDPERTLSTTVPEAPDRGVAPHLGTTPRPRAEPRRPGGTAAAMSEPTVYRCDAHDLARALFEESGDALFLFEPEADELVAVNPVAERL